MADTFVVASTSDIGKIAMSETDTVRNILQCIKCILNTRKGTIPLYREFGVDMSYVDKPLQIARQMLYVAVKEAVQEFEPRVEVVDVITKNDPEDPGRLIPYVEVRIIGDS